MKRIAVVTSGGDAPGMNAAIRAVARGAIHAGSQVFGVVNGYAGLLKGNFLPLSKRSVGGIIQLGGTFLGSARCPDFHQPEFQERAVALLRANDIDGLIVIGGNGSQKGAHAINRLGFPVVGIASTIDNDLFGSEITIGVDSALNVALEAIDRLKITASSHHRAFLVETMGRNSGYLALMAGIAGGAESIIIPEIEVDPEVVADDIRLAYERGKPHAIVVVAEGAKYNADALIDYFRIHEERLGFDIRATRLGHVQRGGHPGVFDRLLGTRFGMAAIEELLHGKAGCLVGQLGGEIRTTPLEVVATTEKPLDATLMDMAITLAQ